MPEKTQQTDDKSAQAQQTTQTTSGAKGATTPAQTQTAASGNKGSSKGGSSRPATTGGGGPSKAPVSRGATTSAAPQPTPAPEPTPASAPLLLIRADARLFESNIWRTLTERRRTLLEERLGIEGQLSRNQLTRRETEEQINFLLTPSPLFDASSVPGSDKLTSTLGSVEGLARDILGLVGDRASKEDVTRLIERVDKARADKEEWAAVENPAGAVVEEGAELAPTNDGEFDPEADEGAEEIALAPVEEEAPVEDFEWRDAYTTPRFPALDELPLDMVKLPDVGEITVIVLDDNLSGHVANLACEVARQGGVDMACIYIRFKQVKEGQTTRYSPWYRYSAFAASVWNDLVEETRGVFFGTQEASVGSYVERVIKDAHERRVVLCQKLTPEGEWANVQTRAERMATKQQQTAPTRQPAPAAQPTPQAPTPARPTAAPPVRQPAPPTSGPRGSVATLGEIVASKGGGLPTARPAPSTRPAAPAQRDELDDVFNG
jgi:hypothetical protein